jgi:hypothetical protein
MKNQTIPQGLLIAEQQQASLILQFNLQPIPSNVEVPKNAQ